MNINSKFGAGLIVVAILITAIGSIGITTKDSAEDIPTPNVQGSVYFSDEPARSNPLDLFISANAEITWDREEVFLVVADEDKKQQCNGLSFIERMNQNGETCTSRDNEFEAVGDDNESGFIWSVESGEYYFGIGSFQDLSSDFELNVDYEVKMTLSPAGYFATFLMLISGVVLNKYQ